MSDNLLPDLIAAVEQQLASSQTPYVTKTYERLIALGLDAEEAKSQIAICLGEEMDQIYRKRRGFDEAAYRKSLEELPFEDEEDEETGEDGEEE